MPDPGIRALSLARRRRHQPVFVVRGTGLEPRQTGWFRGSVDAFGYLRGQDGGPFLPIRFHHRKGVRVVRFREQEPIFFKDVHASFKFCALILGGEERQFDRTECAFFLHDMQTIRDEDRCFPLTPDDFARVNPNTGTAPIFRTRRDADITRRIYERHPVLADRSGGKERKVWPVKYATMFHMANDSHHFRTAAQLECRRVFIRLQATAGSGVRSCICRCTRGRWCKRSTTAPPAWWSTRRTCTGQDSNHAGPHCEEHRDPDFYAGPLNSWVASKKAVWTCRVSNWMLWFQGHHGIN